MHYSERIRDALDRGLPVVAVESSILTHGLSYPRSIHLVLDVEETIRKSGAEPALVAMVEGKISVGLDRATMERLAKSDRNMKLTTADLGVAAAKGYSGGTTAATTAWIAGKAGIRVALAGGLGGVHRDVADTWDISGDLTAMGNTPVLMACGGIKTFLDIGKSLEALETLGVPVWTFGLDRFPGYFVRESAYPAHRVDSGEEAAALAAAHWALGLTSGVVLGVPIPDDAAFDGERIEAVIRRVLKDMEGRTDGRGVTPHIIRAIERETAGQSAAANRALIAEAARRAAETAVALAAIESSNSEREMPR